MIVEESDILWEEDRRYTAVFVFLGLALVAGLAITVGVVVGLWVREHPTPTPVPSTTAVPPPTPLAQPHLVPGATREYRDASAPTLQVDPLTGVSTLFYDGGATHLRSARIPSAALARTLVLPPIDDAVNLTALVPDHVNVTYWWGDVTGKAAAGNVLVVALSNGTRCLAATVARSPMVDSAIMWTPPTYIPCPGGLEQPASLVQSRLHPYGLYYLFTTDGTHVLFRLSADDGLSWTSDPVTVGPGTRVFNIVEQDQVLCALLVSGWYCARSLGLAGWTRNTEPVDGVVISSADSQQHMLLAVDTTLHYRRLLNARTCRAADVVPGCLASRVWVTCTPNTYELSTSCVWQPLTVDGYTLLANSAPLAGTPRPGRALGVAYNPRDAVAVVAHYDTVDGTLSASVFDLRPGYVARWAGSTVIGATAPNATITAGARLVAYRPDTNTFLVAYPATRARVVAVTEVAVTIF